MWPETPKASLHPSWAQPVCSEQQKQRDMVVNYLGVKCVPFYLSPALPKFVFFLEPQMGHCLTQPNPIPAPASPWLVGF